MLIKKFKELSKKNVSIAGGKGASLGEMTQAKIPVPPGFVILVSAFEKFLEETDLNIEINAIMKKIKHNDINSVEKASVQIKDMIENLEIPQDIAKEIKKSFQSLKSKYVAVRSSATAEDSSVASWAGELETYLNVTEKNLLKSVKKCWASLFSPRAIFYRFEKNLQDQKVSVAVVIQKMVQSEISGICFTVHPVTEDKTQMIIEAGWGLGEAVVSGSITPDSYVLNKKNFSIIDINVAEQEKEMALDKKGVKWKKVPSSKQNKQKLKEKELIKLSKLCVQIEKHYQKPQDIEWAIEKNKIYITQSRPITTL